MRKRSKLKISCPNLQCNLFRQKGKLNVIKKGKQKNGVQRYLCTKCKRTFSETANSPFFRKHMKKAELREICKMLANKKSFRSIARKTGRHLDNIRAIASAVAKYHKKFTDYFVHELKLTVKESDAMWHFVSHQKRLN